MCVLATHPQRLRNRNRGRGLRNATTNSAKHFKLKYLQNDLLLTSALSAYIVMFTELVPSLFSATQI